MRSSLVLLLCLLCLVLGFVTERTLTKYFPSLAIRTKSEQLRLGGYSYINPLVDCEVSGVSEDAGDFSPLEAHLSDYITQKTTEGSITKIAVYYRDLNNGPWFGIDEHADFSPASLLKLPVLMAFYKEAVTNPSLLKSEITYDHDVTSLPQRYSQSGIEKGKTYTIENLLESMIQHSDNTALSLLEERIPFEKILKVTIDLGILTPKNTSAENFMSVKEYSSLFRVLYNASYLSRDYSDKVLRMLAKSEFKQGIVAGVPSSVPVAHKYGEREHTDGTEQLHDCGIVYFPNHPYLLCVMTRGNDLDKQKEALQFISKQTYQEVDAHYKK